MSHPIDDSFYQAADAFFTANAPTGLTYDDVTLATRYSSVLPRETALETRLSEGLKLSIPIISSDMDTVTEARMAIAMARMGGLGLIHYNMPERDQVRAVARVKNSIHGLIQDPIRITPEPSIADVLDLIEAKGYRFSTFPVVDEANRLLGLLPGRVVKNRYRNLSVRDAMTPREKLLCVTQKAIEHDPINEADKFFNEHIGIHKLLVVNDNDELCGLFTLSDIERIVEERRLHVRPARDARFRLICGAAICAFRTADGKLDRDRIVNHVSNLVREGVDCLAVSTAHGHSESVGLAVRLLREQFPDVTLIAGNVTSAEGVTFLAEAGADAIKIGQGPGSICTTRVVAGVGIPQLTALYVASKAAAERGVTLIADGGITKSGDIVKALTLSHAVILGSLLAGCEEAPGQLMEIDGKLYKQYRGMGSSEAMRSGSAARYGHVDGDKTAKIAAEGIEALKEVSDSVDGVLTELSAGLQSGMGYLGARNLEELRQRARFIRVTQAGMRESAPHDIIEVKAAKK